MQIEQVSDTILVFWNKLQKVKNLKFVACSTIKSNLGWNGEAIGDVCVTRENCDTLVFNEQGWWSGDNDQKSHFTNVFCWTLDQTSNVIALSHLRRGPENPVYLFQLKPLTDNTLSASEAHRCGQDTYFAHAELHRECIQFTWFIKGPRKNAQITYWYQ